MAEVIKVSVIASPTLYPFPSKIPQVEWLLLMCKVDKGNGIPAGETKIEGSGLESWGAHRRREEFRVESCGVHWRGKRWLVD